MIHYFGEGLRLVSSPAIQPWEQVAMDDWEERLHAMTAHHVVLDLLPLTFKEPVIYETPGALVCHPDVLELVRKTLIEKSNTP